MKKTAMLVVLILVFAAPVFAQGPFNDVPTDHWAYDAVNQLQKDGIIIGYPDGTYGGKRAMSRYEFAVAIARLQIPGAGAEVDTSKFATKDELSKYALKSELPDLSKYATKADVDALRKLIDEFRDEIAALGVDVDALKRDVAALAARVEALEAEQKRVRLTGDVNVFAIASNDRGSLTNPVDLDERVIGASSGAGHQNDTLARTIGVVKDFDLNIVGRVSASTTANATINYGNYLNYVAAVDDFANGERPTSAVDDFFPYYLYIGTALGKGDLTVGRFPLQFTPYTLKKIDVDSYTSILKTDDGNYPLDGIKLGWGFGGVDLTLFAAKSDSNVYLANGLTGQPNSGLYGPNTGSAYDFFPTIADTGVVGSLSAPITQSAGVRATVGTPWKGTLGATFYQSWAEGAYFGGADYDQARVWGFDLAIPVWKLGVAGSWTRSDTLSANGSSAADLDDDNTAWDVKLTAGLGKLGIGAGYKRIERQFAAAGSWDKIGHWQNPTDIKGPYVDFNYPIGRKLNVVLNGEWLKMIDTVTTTPSTAFGVANDEIFKAEGGIKWGISKSNSLDLGYQWVKFDPKGAGLDEAIETYLTIGWAHQLSENTGFKVGYQLINYDDGADKAGPYINDYRGGLGVVQFGVTF